MTAIDENINEAPRVYQRERRPSFSGSITQSKALVDALSER